MTNLDHRSIACMSSWSSPSSLPRIYIYIYYCLFIFKLLIIDFLVLLFFRSLSIYFNQLFLFCLLHLRCFAFVWKKFFSSSIKEFLSLIHFQMVLPRKSKITAKRHELNIKKRKTTITNSNTKKKITKVIFSSSKIKTKLSYFSVWI